jgi:hypothetical protein
LAASSNTLAEVKSLLDEPVLFARLDYRQGFNLLLPHLAHLKRFGQCLGGGVAVSLHAGQLETAKEHLIDVLATAKLLEKESVIVSQLVRVALVSIAVTGTWQALQCPGWTDAQLLELQRSWQSVQLLPQLVSALEMERAVTLEVFASMRRSGTTISSMMGSGPSNPGNTNSGSDLFSRIVTQNIMAPIWQWSFSYEDERHYLQTMQNLLDVTRACARERSVSSVRSAKAQLEQVTEETGFGRVRHMMSLMFASSVIRTLDKALNSETQKELVLAALAVRRYSLKHGHPPDTLEALVPEWIDGVPRDYWGGGSLHYRTNTNAEPSLYSTGADGLDSNGDASGIIAKSPPLFSGRDMVWPVAATEAELPEALKLLGCNVLK